MADIITEKTVSVIISEVSYYPRKEDNLARYLARQLEVTFKDEGTLFVEEGAFNGLNSTIRKKVIDYLIQKGFGLVGI